MSSDVDKEEIQRFLNRKAALEEITAIGQGQQLFKEISSQVSVSPGTLSNRLEEGREAGVIEQVLVEDEEAGKSKAGYGLTGPGDRIYELIEKEDLPGLLEKKRKLDEKVEHKIDRVKDWEQLDFEEI